MAELDGTSLAYALKTLYEQEAVVREWYEDNPLFALIPKWKRFGGKNFVEAVVHGVNAGRSHTFSTAQTNADNHRGVSFTVTRKKDYAVAKIDGETLLASESDENTLVEGLKTEMDGAIHNLVRSAAVDLYGDGSGARGQVGSVSSGVITLKNINDVTNFEVGQKIVANPTKTGAAGSMRSGTGTVSVVDRDLGKVTYTGTITSIAADDYIYTEGDYDKAITGVGGWIPATAPSSGESFFGVDRSVDTKLSGVIFDGATLNPSEAIFKAAVRVGREGGAPRHVFMNTSDWANLQLDLGSKVIYDVVKSTGVEVGFTSIAVRGPRGSIQCVADPNCPAGTAFMLGLKHWKLRSLGEIPRFLDEDGKSMLRQSSSDGYEVRAAYYANLTCNAPGFNARIKLPT